MTALSGRKAEAARNDQVILESARAVFMADPNAPISAVAEHAGVGISALYRRYKSKDELLQKLALDGLQRYIAEAEAALADDGDAWTVFAAFMERCVDGGAASLTRRLAGTFTATEQLNQTGYQAYQLTQRVLDRSREAGVLRSDINVTDLSLIFEQLQSVAVHDAGRTGQLRRRYLHLMLQSMRSPAEAGELPGPPPEWEEIRRRYDG
ncbi:helix-turn-helix domain-containing protein [Actinocorallia longicatena]|uniref:TetR/AcrR family transcriptional regulator n=1 Tax=Actinocorallia longicatena TaxID=111803 RepID=A0ABP6Q9E8_9ACTN